jgi:mannosyltransferase
MERKIGAVGAERVLPLQTLLFRLGLGFTLLLAALLRFYRLAGQSLWSDEGNSVSLAQAGLAEIASRTALDIHPPLYYWLLHGWMRIFGQSEVAVRSMSALAGVLLVAVIYRLGVRLFPSLSKRVGLLAAFIAAVSPFQVYYAQETRMYALLALWGALVIWAAVELMSNGEQVAKDEPAGRSRLVTHYPIPLSRYSFLYVLCAILGLYTHYAFPVILVAANLAVLVSLWRGRDTGQVARWLAGWLMLQLIPLTLYLPWLPVAWRQLTTWPTPPPTEVSNAWITVWRTLIFGPAGVEVSDLWMIGLGLLGLVGVARIIWEGRLPETTLLLLYLGLPVGLTLTLFRPAYLKFLLIASPALCLLLAVGLAGGRAWRGLSWGGWLGAGLLVAAAWAPLKAYYTDPAVARDDYRGVARYLEAAAGPEDAIILNAAGQQEVFGYYYRGASPVYPLPRRRPLDPVATVTELESILGRSRRIFALYWATAESDPEGVIEGWLDGHAFKATDAWVGNVRLVSYAAPLPAGDLLPTNVRLGDHVTLTGYQLLAPSPSGDFAGTSRSSSTTHSSGTLPPQTAPGEIVQVQLRWTTDVPLDARYVVFLQVLDEVNHLAGQRDAEPVTPTLDWRPNQPVLDRHGLLIEPGTPPGKYRVIVGMYDALTSQRLPTASGDFVELGALTVQRPEAPLPVAVLRFRHPANVDFGPLRLLGYDRYKLGHSYHPDTPLHPGDPLHVVLYWQAQDRLRTNWLLEMKLAAVADPALPVAEGLFPAAGLDYPTTRWEPEEVVRAQFDLFLPGDAPSGDYRVSLSLIDENGSPGTEVFSLIPISVE